VQKRVKDQQYSNEDLRSADPQGKHEHKIDITIVVDMLLTGFDSKYEARLKSVAVASLHLQIFLRWRLIFHHHNLFMGQGIEHIRRVVQIFNARRVGRFFDGEIKAGLVLQMIQAAIMALDHTGLAAKGGGEVSQLPGFVRGTTHRTQPFIGICHASDLFGV
jgi:hypothetical protein